MESVESVIEQVRLDIKYDWHIFCSAVVEHLALGATPFEAVRLARGESNLTSMEYPNYGSF